jgi:UrcA family protein
MNKLTSRIATVAALALAAVPFVAVASQAAAAERVAHIRVADIDLNSVEGQIVLKARSASAIRNLCFSRDIAYRLSCEAGVRAEIAEKAAIASQAQLASKTAQPVTLAIR